jgi:hypothetical protein
MAAVYKLECDAVRNTGERWSYEYLVAADDAEDAIAKTRKHALAKKHAIYDDGNDTGKTYKPEKIIVESVTRASDLDIA